MLILVHPRFIHLHEFLYNIYEDWPSLPLAL